MNVLLLGSGGREHALAWKLAQSAGIGKLFAAPGNPGIAAHAELVALDPADHAAILDFCRARSVGLVVIGPEAPLVAGLADDCRAAGIPVFGPGQAAARLEGSKAFTKELCRAEGIPTAGYAHVRTRQEGQRALEPFGLPVVIKADGLAAGKGVTIAMTHAEAEAALDALFADGDGEAVIEEFLSGEEVSLFALTDGEAVVSFGSAQDHKRVGDGDVGPNTGGMGAYAPLSWLPDDTYRAIVSTIVEPVAAELVRRGSSFSGLLYAGLAITSNGPSVIEFNCRFGDPETQSVLALLESPLGQLLNAAATGTLASFGALQWRAGAAVTVVVAAENSPGKPRVGDVIAGSEAAGVLHAGTARDADGAIVSSGGRVLSVVGTGPDLDAARAAAYDLVRSIRLPGSHFRTDIGLAAAEGKIRV